MLIDSAVLPSRVSRPNPISSVLSCDSVCRSKLLNASESRRNVTCFMMCFHDNGQDRFYTTMHGGRHRPDDQANDWSSVREPCRYSLHSALVSVDLSSFPFRPTSSLHTKVKRHAHDTL